ncbi:MAG: hypothetical protein LBP62_03205 [Clostridiales bacterium]|jgi:hypothetical protein|nr:hypothetical protein [Clostridiales bacterium]
MKYQIVFFKWTQGEGISYSQIAEIIEAKNDGSARKAFKEFSDDYFSALGADFDGSRLELLNDRGNVIERKYYKYKSTKKRF